MPRTKKTLLPKNLLQYEVYEEDTSVNSDYFNILNLPQVFTGGRNSFYLDGSDYLKSGTSLLIEILDVNGNTIYFTPKVNYVEGTAILVSIEIYDSTPTGLCTLTIMGQIERTIDGYGIPDEWKDTYNVRWTKKIMVDPTIVNRSQIRFNAVPELVVKEQQFYNIATSSFTSESLRFTASLSPIYESSDQSGYLITAQSPTSFSAALLGGVITGSITISSSVGNSIESASINLFIDDILNSTTSFATSARIITDKNRIIDSLYLRSGSYTTQVISTSDVISSSAVWTYNKLSNVGTTVPISYADIRITNLSTLSGEIYKTRIYARPAITTGEYKLVADTQLIISDLLVTESVPVSSSIGYVSVGDFFAYPTASKAWYTNILTLSAQDNSVSYPTSGSIFYYSSSISESRYDIRVSSTTSLDSMFADIPVDTTVQQFTGSVSQSGYFIGTRNSLVLTPTTEYTLQLDSYYKNTSGSSTLTGNTPRVDIYIIGVNGTRIIDDNPLGQLVGQLVIPTGASQKRFQQTQFNFTPQLVTPGQVGLRFVVTNGFWNFSNIYLTPAYDNLFSPDEVKLLIPNTEFYNQYLQYKVEFFDINNNSTSVSVESIPAFFTGSSIDLGNII